MKASEFDEIFDNGGDVLQYCDLSGAKRPYQKKIETTGQLAYELYASASYKENVKGKPLPDWDDLPEETREMWNTAAHSVDFFD